MAVSMRRVVVLALALGLLCSAGAASAAGKGPQLDLMPLPRSALGAGGGGLVLAPDSGVVSNASAAKDAGAGYTATGLAKRGRITGYSLDYVRPNVTVPAPRNALVGVRTIAELYSNQSTATRGLAFWRGVTRKLSGPQANGVTVTVAPFPGEVADGAFAFELTDHFRGQPLYHVGDVVFRSGNLLGAVFVSATDSTGLRSRTLKLADSFASRIKRVAAGDDRGLRAPAAVRH